MSRKRSMTEQKIRRWLKEGRGQGSLTTYKPWLTIRDVPSRGWRNRIRGFVTGRTHHFLSNYEADLFRILDLSPFTFDINEQVPLLPLAETQAIAHALGIEHPRDPVSKVDMVMTTDFLWFQKEKIPIDVKPVEELSKPRVIEKLEIVRVYWKTRGLTWKLTTQLDIDPTLAENCKRLHKNMYMDVMSINIRDLKDIAQIMTEEVLQKERPLRIIARDVDDQQGLNIGTCLRVAYHFIARRYWQVNWYQPINPSDILDIHGISSDFDFSKSLKSTPNE